MRPAATIQSARAEMDAIAARLAEEHPSTNTGLGVLTDSLLDRVVGTTTNRALWVLSASVGFVLLIGCANVASLVLRGAPADMNTRCERRSVRAGCGWCASCSRSISCCHSWREPPACSSRVGAIALRTVAAGGIAEGRNDPSRRRRAALPAGRDARDWSAGGAVAGAATVDDQAGRGARRGRSAIARRPPQPPHPPGARRRGNRACRGAAGRCRTADPQFPPRSPPAAASIRAACCCCRSIHRRPTIRPSVRLTSTMRSSGCARCPASRQPARSATSSSTVSPITGSRSKGGRRAGSTMRRRRRRRIKPAGLLRSDANSAAARPVAARQRSRAGRAAGGRHQR